MTGKLGSDFYFKSDGRNFTIPGIELDQKTGALTVSDFLGNQAAFGDKEFITYVRGDNTGNL